MKHRLTSGKRGTVTVYVLIAAIAALAIVVAFISRSTRNQQADDANTIPPAMESPAPTENDDLAPAIDATLTTEPVEPAALEASATPVFAPPPPPPPPPTTADPRDLPPEG